MHSLDLFVKHCGQAVIQRYVSLLSHALFEFIKFVVAKKQEQIGPYNAYEKNVYKMLYAQ